MGAVLKPYIALFIAMSILLLTTLYSKYQKKALFTGLVIMLIFSVLFVVFPAKIVFVEDSNELVKVIPVVYGLPTEEGWSQIEQGSVYPGGDVTNSSFNVKYAIVIRN